MTTALTKPEREFASGELITDRPHWLYRGEGTYYPYWHLQVDDSSVMAHVTPDKRGASTFHVSFRDAHDYFRDGPDFQTLTDAKRFAEEYSEKLRLEFER